MGISLEPLANIRIRHEFKPGDLGRLIELHGLLYFQEYNFDPTFEAYVAKPMAEFLLTPTSRERIWLVDFNNTLMGSIAIVRHSDTDAQLRWYLLHPSLRSKGLGRWLMHEAIDFCNEQRYQRIFLWTVSALTDAAAVYHKFEFRLAEEQAHTIWGCPLTEQRYVLEL